jgi:protein phosphatase methylesterase 1
MLKLIGVSEWYLHLSSSFLAAKPAKLLVLAGQERLDRELMVGQM